MPYIYNLSAYFPCIEAQESVDTTTVCSAAFITIGSSVFDYMIRVLIEELHANQIDLHVQDGNAKAVRFYHKFGFKTVSRLENYYKRLDNPAALHLVLDL